MPSTSFRYILVLLFGLAVLGPTSARASEKLAQVVSPLIQQAVRSSLPTRFQDESDWGRTHEFTQRVKLRGSLLKPRLERVKKEKSHGDWVRYKGRIENPDEAIEVWIENLQIEPTQTACQIHARIQLLGEAEYQQWVRGTRLMGVSVVADATVHLWLDVRLKTEWTSAGLISSARVTPEVTSAGLRLESFYVHRIGRAHGQVAEKIGDEILEDILAKKLAKADDKLVRAANKAIRRQLDENSLRLDLLRLIRAQLRM